MTYFSSTQDFFESNSLVAKVAFLMLALIIFIFLLRSGINIIGWLLSPSGNIKLIDGMINARHSELFLQDPNQTNSKPILRSINKSRGIEFTWSVWIFIDNLDENSDQYKHIFHKGNDKMNYTNAPIGLNEPNNGPGLYITPNKNDLLVIMNTFEKIDEKITVQDIPLNKWVNIIIRCENKTVDVYINGRISNRHKSTGVPFQNYGDVYVALNGGFPGYISNLWYWNKSLNTSDIQSLVNSGPNMSMSDNKNLSQSSPQYLSLRWFFSNTELNKSDYGGL
jgi:hypothetical protein